MATQMVDGNNPRTAVMAQGSMLKCREGPR
ncbi:predicted protein [Sclerotinia sclerotiorum 1980 UF-70]|uniref:Uncharacterized protein n=1 Tax=Sclerotinia sclerotiorum (strain ATCC 18683 / 1980 / Ss-1) TaxID=665079 RepID=A7ELW9_SCLS1|nr:predicted protein [Sclerotinia sclerotiorum 1980 UF-70]EDO03835.1 predicted protein [Sclerotinia sclerotiorum 1980 UF-70]